MIFGNNTWQPHRWGDLATLEYGKGLRGYKDYIAEYPVYGTNGPIGWCDEPLVTAPGVIIGRKGAYRGVHYSNTPFFVIDTAFYLSVNYELVDIKWAYYQLLDFDINNIDSGTAIPSTSRDAFYAIPVLLPPLPTQRKIAGILSAYDDLIENNVRRIALLEEMAQLIYREWFVHFRFPGHEGVKMVNSEPGPIPEGWEVANLAELVDTQYGYTASASEEEIGPKFVRGMDINKTSYIDWERVPYCPISSDEIKKYLLEEGDILIVRMADPGKVGMVETPCEAVFASYLIRLKIISDSISPYFLCYFLMADRYQGYISGASTGTTRKSASAGVITDIDIVIPPSRIREQFDEDISSMRELLTTLVEINSNLRQTRDLLLPRLIAGQMDISELDI